MSEKSSLSPDEISEIMRGLDPIDWVQMELLAKLPPSRRIFPVLQASAMLRAGLRTAFRKRYSELSMPEINMKVLEYLNKYG